MLALRGLLRAIATAVLATGQLAAAQEATPDVRDSAAAIDTAGELVDAGEYEEALQYYQRAVSLLEADGDRRELAQAYDSLGRLYARTRRYGESAGSFERALTIWRELGSDGRTSASLHNLGLVQQRQRDYTAALESFEAALALRRSNVRGAAESLTGIGNALYFQARYASALAANRNALALWTILEDDRQRSSVLSTLGAIHTQIAQYDGAIRALNEALTLSRALGDDARVAVALHNLGYAYSRMGRKDAALRMYQDALEARRQTGDRLGVGYDLNNLGYLYAEIGLHDEALEHLHTALDIFREGDSADHRRGEGQTLDSLGTVYKSRNENANAETSYTQALAVQRAVPDIAALRTTYANLADLYDRAGNVDVAIAFYKQSVTTTESIRQDLTALSASQQELYARTVEPVYRRLADLLLQQGRTMEAKRVLDLLKLQELQQYLHTIAGNADSERGMAATQEEAAAIRDWIDRSTRAIELGRELWRLRQIEDGDRTSTDREDILRLEQLQQALNREYNRFVASFDAGDTASLEALELTALRDNLRNLDAVLLYPLILDDRLELILATPYTAPRRARVDVSRHELEELVQVFRAQLSTPATDPAATAQRLYRLLIAPLERELRDARATTILYAPDGVLRYIPLAALNDGEKWLAERFRVNNITSTSLIDFDAAPPARTRVLAGAFTRGFFEFPVAGATVSFAGLPYAGIEIENIADIVADTTMVADTGLTRRALLELMDDHSIVHLATHATFVPGLPEESFILLGDGDRVTLADIQAWALQNVSLMVLSACETGLGGFSDGREILGFGYLVEKAGVRSAIASLWSIDDGGTQIFMSELYERLRDRGATKLAALNAAQRAMISDGGLADSRIRGVATELPALRGGNLDHPHYWAPFILIGNGL